MATFTTQPFHELLDSDKTNPSTVLDSDGKLKQSLHNVLSSTDFLDTDEWSHNNVTVTESGTSPSGKKAYLVTETTASGQRSVSEPAAYHGYTNRYSCASVDVKRGTGSRHCVVRVFQGGGTIDYGISLDDGTATRTGVGTLDSCIVTELSDGWFNVKVYYENTNDGFGFTILLAEDAVGDINYTGDGSSSIYVSRPRVYEASVHAPVERFENTDFASDTIWGKTNWTIGSGVASKTVGTAGGLSQAVDLVAGEKYRIEVTVSNYVAGVLTARLASAGGLGANTVLSENITANGTYVFILTALSSSAYAGFFGEDTFDGDIDDVSLTKVINDGIQNDLDGEDFIETSGSAIYHGGLEYNGDGSFRGIQSFEGRTNVQKYSYLNDTNWNDTNITMTLNSTVGVDGDLSAHTIDDQNTSSSAYLERIESGVASNNQVWTGSFFVKKTSGNTHYCGFLLALIGGATTIDRRMAVNTNTGVVSGTLSSPTATRVEDYGDYWRVIMTVTNNATGNTNAYFRIYPAMSTDGTASEDVSATGSQIVYGAQLEAGSSASPYIPTDSSTRTRVKDTIHKDLVEFGFNQNELTVLCEFESAGSTGSDFPWAFCISDGSGDYRYGTYGYVAGSNKTFVFNINSDEGAAINANYESNYTPYSTIRTMFGFKGNDNAVSDDGDTVVTNSRAIPENVNLLNVASENSFSQQLNGHVKKLIIWPKRLANATLEAESV